MSALSQSSQCAYSSLGCFVYDFQTLLTGLAAIVVAVIAGIPVWRQLRDTNLQTRISHRETLSNLLRDSLRRFARVDQSIGETLSTLSRVTSDPIGEPTEIDPHDAHHLEQQVHGALDWYLVVLADTEHADIERAKVVLKNALDRLVTTLGEAHWADHNDQHDEDHAFTDAEWADILAKCAAAKVDASARVGEAAAAHRALQTAQQAWVQSLRAKISRLDLQIAAR